ncbi:MAG: CRISPR-associated endonuclease Cas1 [Ignavibacteriaceae bacterium]|nr:CRISPR-associated endonuclease Cas1 [Ignavibacteriaceae bacterium]
MAVCAWFGPLIDKQFVNSSYAYRPAKGHAKAIARINDYLARRFTFAAPFDIDNFFDTINHELLIKICSGFFDDEAVLELIAMWIKTGAVTGNKYVTAGKGVAQGGVISPLLSNIYLHSFDKALEARGTANVRYADNIVLLAKNPELLKDDYFYSTDYLRQNLQLEINKNPKPFFTPDEGFSFCGIFFKDRKKLIDEPRLEGLKKKLPAVITSAQAGEFVEKVNFHLDGIRRYYGFADAQLQLRELDDLIERALADRMRVELRKQTLKSFKEAKQILIKLHLLSIQEEEAKKEFINRVLNRLKEKQQEVSKADSRKSDSCGRGSFKPIIPEIKITTDGVKLRSQTRPATGLKLAESANPPTPAGGLVVKSEEAVASAQKKIDKRKRYYHRIWFSNLDLCITTPGMIIGKNSEMISAKLQGKIVRSVSMRSTKSVLIAAKGVSLSSDLVFALAEKDIRMDFFDGIGRPVASLIPAESQFYAMTRLQSEAASSEKGVHIAKELISAKVRNQIATLKYFTKARNGDPAQKKEIAQYISQLHRAASLIDEIPEVNPPEDWRNKMLGYEGSAGAVYWECIKLLIGPSVYFEHREHKGSKDLVNMMFNYAYGVLYVKISGAVTITGLNPNTGFLHTDQKGKQTLVFDLIEPFRAPIADRTIITMINLKMKTETEGELLSKATKDILLKKIISRFHTEFLYRGKKQSYADIIPAMIKELSLYLKGEKQQFKAYRAKW